MLFALRLHTEMLPEGLEVTAVGFGMVFILLVLICVTIMLFSYVNRLVENRAKQAEPKVTESKPVAPVAPQPVAAEPKATDDLELIAVITAAIAASANVSADKLVIKSLKRVNLRSGWSSQALIDQQNSQY